MSAMSESLIIDFPRMFAVGQGDMDAAIRLLAQAQRLGFLTVLESGLTGDIVRIDFPDDFEPGHAAHTMQRFIDGGIHPTCLSLPAQKQKRKTPLTKAVIWEGG